MHLTTKDLIEGSAELKAASFSVEPKCQEPALALIGHLTIRSFNYLPHIITITPMKHINSGIF